MKPGGLSASEPAELKLTFQPLTQGPTKTCPFCCAQIPEDAWTCMYCKRGVIGGKPLAIGLTMVVVLFMAIIFFGFMLPGCMDMQNMQKKHKDIEQEFNQIWQDHEK